MGSFSYTRAEHTTDRANLTDGDFYKILIPKEFGGGSIWDVYEDCGEINTRRIAVYKDPTGKVFRINGIKDIYGVFSYLNNCKSLDYDGKKPKTILDILKFGNTCAQTNRGKGIDLFFDKKRKPKYPLKIVSDGYNKTYEECPGQSYSDPNQGFGAGYWDRSNPDLWYDYLKIKEKLIEAENKAKKLTLDELIDAGYSIKEINEKYKNEETTR